MKMRVKDLGSFTEVKCVKSYVNEFKSRERNYILGEKHLGTGAE